MTAQEAFKNFLAKIKALNEAQNQPKEEAKIEEAPVVEEAPKKRGRKKKVEEITDAE